LPSDKDDFSIYSPGAVFYSLPGHTAFPVRLTLDIFLQCGEYLQAMGIRRPYRLFDPCCGGAYHLAVLTYQHPGAFLSITASDIDADAVALAERNLSLLTSDGLDRREVQIREMASRFGKASHQTALEQVQRLRALQASLTPIPRLHTFQADAFDSVQLAEGLGENFVDLVMTDIPYGWKSNWILNSGRRLDDPPAVGMLEALLPLLSPGAVVAVAADKEQSLAHNSFRRLKRMKIGKRQVVFLTPDLSYNDSKS
jgi:hypothetical protein